MRREWHLVPAMLVLVAGVAMILHGPIRQWPGYHDFADQRGVAGIPHAWDVLSNIPFALVGLWAAWRTRRAPASPQRAAEQVFYAALVLTALGSAYYHWAPDNARLVFDRLPIAVACAALLCAMHARIIGGRIPGLLPVLLGVAVLSVLWWDFTQARGNGDLRPYLLLQGAPLVMVPLWQWIHAAPPAERILVAMAVALYAAAKALELEDRAVLEATGFVSGHTVKHLLAAAASLVLCRVLQR